MRELLFLRFLTGCSLLIIPLTLPGQPYGLDSRSPIGPGLNYALPVIPPGSVTSGGWTTVVAFTNLVFDDPITLVPEPRANRLYVCQREGTIHFFDNHPGASNKTLFLDIRARTQGFDDCGLLGLVFHPEFRLAGSTNRNFVYIYYNYTPDPFIPGGNKRPPPNTKSYNRLSRFTVPDGSLVADPNSEFVLINQYDRHLWHNGGSMFFGQDGFLYLINGDEGGADDNYNNTQKINSGLFSGVLRLDVDQDPARSHPIRRQPLSVEAPPAGWPPSYSSNYYIPNDNPWVNPDGSVLEEFWAIGLRSPHRMTYDPVSGQIWNGDVGQADREEINLLLRGGNYQWAYMEGTIPGPKAKPSVLIGTERPPVHDYPHADGNSCVIGGFVYRGTEHAGDLYGKYIFGDNWSGRIWSLSYSSNGTSVVTFLGYMPDGQNYTGLSSFGVDQNNELYMLQMGANGQIWKLARSGPPNPPAPALLSQTGFFTNFATLGTRQGVIPYEVNSELWSDGAYKMRWIAVPNDGAPFTAAEQVSFSPAGEWTFPNGTVLAKHFELATNETQMAARKRLETRFLVRATNGAYYGLTYKWRADNSDADLLSGSVAEAIPIATASGLRTQTWYYPSQGDCFSCHTPAAGFVLGVKTRQLNGGCAYLSTGRTDNQLRTWNHVGLLNPPIEEAAIASLDRLAPVSDISASLSYRVRSYLDANCAHCHRPGGVRANFDAVFDTPLENQNLLNGYVNETLGIAGAKVISPGRHEQSILYARVNTNGAIRMPPVARNEIDARAVSLISDWITQVAQPAWQTVLPTPTNTVISWASIAGSAYRVQSRSNLADAPWLFIPGEITATGSVSSIIDSRPPMPQAFYRVVLLP